MPYRRVHKDELPEAVKMIEREGETITIVTHDDDHLLIFTEKPLITRDIPPLGNATSTSPASYEDMRAFFHGGDPSGGGR